MHSTVDLQVMTLVCLAHSGTMQHQIKTTWTRVHQRNYGAHPSLNLKLKGKAEHLYSALHGIQTTLKRSEMDRTV